MDPFVRWFHSRTATAGRRAARLQNCRVAMPPVSVLHSSCGCRFVKRAICRTVQDFQDVIVPERPAVHCSKQGDVDSASRTCTTHPQSRQAVDSPIHVHQRTNHVGRLVLLAGAPGSPTGSTAGLLQQGSLQHRLVHGFGRLPTSPSRKDRPTKYSQRHRTPKAPNQTKRIQGETTRQRRQSKKKRGKSAGPRMRRYSSLLSLLSAVYYSWLPNNAKKNPNHSKAPPTKQQTHTHTNLSSRRRAPK